MYEVQPAEHVTFTQADMVNAVNVKCTQSSDIVLIYNSCWNRGDLLAAAAAAADVAAAGVPLLLLLLLLRLKAA